MTATAPNCDQSCADAGQTNIKVPQRNSHGFVTEWCIDENAVGAKRPGRAGQTSQHPTPPTAP